MTAISTGRDMEIALTQELVAIVDAQDFDLVQRHKWCADKRGNTYYAVTNVPHPNRKGYTKLRMHRLILGLDRDDPRMGDHRDGNGLNNRRSNLRIASASQNAMNRRSRKGSSSQFVGVAWNKHHGVWEANIQREGKPMWLGRFDLESDAAHAYDVAALEIHGEFARTNFSLQEMEI